MITIEVKQDREVQVVLEATDYHLRKTTNPPGWAILIKKDEMTKFGLLCPGCEEILLDGDGRSENCACYRDLTCAS